jgi:hypothetical protein
MNWQNTSAFSANTSTRALDPDNNMQPGNLTVLLLLGELALLVRANMTTAGVIVAAMTEALHHAVTGGNGHSSRHQLQHDIETLLTTSLMTLLARASASLEA